jgi:DNA-directed RNA polymerase specialized sigma24 family protein
VKTPSPRASRAPFATVAQRVLFNHYRRQKLEQAYLDALAQLPSLHALSPEERALLLSTVFELDRMLDGLPPPVKRVYCASSTNCRRKTSRASSASRWPP